MTPSPQLLWPEVSRPEAPVRAQETAVSGSQDSGLSCCGSSQGPQGWPGWEASGEESAWDLWAHAFLAWAAPPAQGLHLPNTPQGPTRPGQCPQHPPRRSRSFQNVTWKHLSLLILKRLRDRFRPITWTSPRHLSQGDACVSSARSGTPVGLQELPVDERRPLSRCCYFLWLNGSVISKRINICAVAVFLQNRSGMFPDRHYREQGMMGCPVGGTSRGELNAHLAELRKSGRRLGVVLTPGTATVFRAGGDRAAPVPAGTARRPPSHKTAWSLWG